MRQVDENHSVVVQESVVKTLSQEDRDFQVKVLLVAAELSTEIGLAPRIFAGFGGDEPPESARSAIFQQPHLIADLPELHTRSQKPPRSLLF